MYRIGRFATIAGVTVKALYHYERHGLLSPQRTDAGYRRYSHHDLSRLRRIMALKSLGFSLKQIALVQHDAARLPAECARQRQALDERRALIDRAVDTLDIIARDHEPMDALDRFVADRCWNQAETARQAVASPGNRAPDRASPSKLALFRETAAALDGEADAEAIQRLLVRWDAVLEDEADGNAETHAAIRKAWGSCRTWPDGMRKYIASLFAAEPSTFERVAEFIHRGYRPAAVDISGSRS